MCHGSLVGEVFRNDWLYCVGSDATKYAEALEADSLEAGRAGLPFKEVRVRGEQAVALSEVVVWGFEPWVGELVVVMVKGGASGGRALRGRRVLGRKKFDICRACATIGVVMDEGCPGCVADEGGLRASRSGVLSWGDE